MLQVYLQQVLPFPGFPAQNVCGFLQVCEIPGFAAEAQKICAEAVKQCYTAGGKVFCAGSGKHCRKLYNQVCAAAQCHAGAGVFVEDGGFSALDKISAHGCDDIICSGLAPDFFYLVLVAVVKRIVSAMMPAVLIGSIVLLPFC